MEMVGKKRRTRREWKIDGDRSTSEGWLWDDGREHVDAIDAEQPEIDTVATCCRCDGRGRTGD